jgi:5'-3' exonuclease
LDIGDGAFDLLFDTYKEQRPTWGDGEYLTRAGEIKDPARLEAFLTVIGAAETEIFELREENDAKYIKKKRRWDKRDGKQEGLSDKQLAAIENEKQFDYQSMIGDLVQEHGMDGKFVDGWELPTDGSKKDYKGRYYFEKLKFKPVDIDSHLALRQSYIEGLMWCLAYYYKGCISWGWFYPYHYGPLISDLTDLKNVFKNIKFEIGAPLKPFEQLMGCLPPASASIVPRPYRKLMSSDSPIAEFYPQQFEVDMNGKK